MESVSLTLARDTGSDGGPAVTAPARGRDTERHSDGRIRTLHGGTAAIMKEIHGRSLLG
ncbi:hypothetical protein [Streptomyces nodosus]|uniref:hypothetical protein n=1 Tax=Streptomyces nodosus TaxID=40318 RepID=UPI0037F2A424